MNQLAFDSPEIKRAYTTLVANRSTLQYVKSFLIDISHDNTGPLDLRSVIGHDVSVNSHDMNFYKKYIDDLVNTLPCVQNGCANVSVLKTIDKTKVHGWDYNRVTILDVKWELTDHGQNILQNLMALGSTNVMFDRQTYVIDIDETIRLLEIAFQNREINLIELIGDIDEIEDDRLLEIKRLAVMEKLSRSQHPHKPKILYR